MSFKPEFFDHVPSQDKSQFPEETLPAVSVNEKRFDDEDMNRAVKSVGGVKVDPKRGL